MGGRTTAVRSGKDFRTVAHSSGVSVTIAVPTFRRLDLLRHLLPQLSAQIDDARARCRFLADADILVVDNDPEETAAGAVADVVAGLAHRVVVIHEPVPGVSAVRNTSLDRTIDRDVLIFIDDDETPHPGWLVHLLQTWHESGAAAVAGRVVSEFQVEPDPWVRAGDFFRRRSLPTGTPIEVAATNNLLLDRSVIAGLGLHFDPSLGRSGGEDTVFTRSLTRSGALMVWCNEAVVTDIVPADRVSRAWVLARAYSYGNSSAIAELRLTGGPAAMVARLRWILLGGLRIVAGTARSLFGRAARNPRHDARGRRTARRGAGMVAGALGRIYHEYDRPDSAPVTVLESFPVPRPTTNPYITQLHRALLDEPGLTVITFSWRAALLEHYDVFHTHWPEILVDGHSRLKKAVRQALFGLLLLRLRVRRTPVVRTLHNLEIPSGLSAVQRGLLARLDRLVTTRIVLNETTQVPASDHPELLLHGDYRSWFAGEPRVPAVPGRVGYVGLIRRYKNVAALVRAFRQLPNEQAASLHISGRPSSDELLSELGEAADGDPRITIRPEFLDDAQLAREVQESELLVLPYQEMHNSGTVLLALSFHRPVLVPDNPTTAALAAEVGSVWVQRYAGEFTSGALARALAAVRAAGLIGSDRAPDLHRRSWSTAGAQHLAVFRGALRRRS